MYSLCTQMFVLREDRLCDRVLNQCASSVVNVQIGQNLVNETKLDEIKRIVNGQ